MAYTNHGGTFLVEGCGRRFSRMLELDRLLPDGYGRFSSGKGTLAHRYSYELANGPIPPGRMIDHTCHNKRCVNPAHLRLATAKQNAENRAGADSRSTSGIRGVSWSKSHRKWRPQVKHNGHAIYLGLYTTREEAEAVVTATRKELFTHTIEETV